MSSLPDPDLAAVPCPPGAEGWWDGLTSRAQQAYLDAFCALALLGFGINRAPLYGSLCTATRRARPMVYIHHEGWRGGGTRTTHTIEVRVVPNRPRVQYRITISMRALHDRPIELLDEHTYDLSHVLQQVISQQEAWNEQG